MLPTTPATVEVQGYRLTTICVRRRWHAEVYDQAGVRVHETRGGFVSSYAAAVEARKWIANRVKELSSC